MEFQKYFFVYKTAIDFAKENQEMVDLLSKGPIQPIKLPIQPIKPPIDLKPTLSNPKIEELENEISKLKSYLLILREKSTNTEPVNVNDYKEGKTIGEGASSIVKEVFDDKKLTYAKKELQSFDSQSLRYFLNEIEVLIQLRHPCIVRIYGYNYGDATNPPSIYLSFEPNSLESIKNKELSDEEKNRITVEIVLGMRYIHSNNLIHRDLKPGNILLSKNKHARITDFGLTKDETLEISLTKGVGTLRFMAPELLNDQDEDEQQRYNNKVDVYAFGIILIYIVIGKYPKHNFRDVVNGILPELPSTVVPWVVELIHNCLQLLPENRPTFNEIFEILKSHNFDLFNGNTTKLTAQQQQNKKDIEHRILKIEAYEYQHQLFTSTTH